MALETVTRYSFPSNHMVTVQLVRDPANTDSLKPLYFFMLALIPGISGDNGRTYDFKNGTHVKYGLHEMFGLSFALKQYAGGNYNQMNYVKFSKSQNVNKIVTLLVDQETKNSGGKDITTRMIHLRFSVGGGSAQSVKLTCDQAFAMGEIIAKMCDIGANSELTREVNADSFKQQYNQQPQRQQPQQQQPQQSPEQNFGGDDGGGFSNFGNNPFG